MNQWKIRTGNKTEGETSFPYVKTYGNEVVLSTFNEDYYLREAEVQTLIWQLQKALEKIRTPDKTTEKKGT